MNKSKANQGNINNQDQDFILLDSMKPMWYVVQTYVGFEDAVKKLIDQKIENLNLSEKILEIFIPIKKVIKLSPKGVRKEKEEKVYPGYVYINMILDREVGYMLQNTNYVYRIASTGNVAVALEEGYIEKLKEKLLRESSENTSIYAESKYNLGDLVEVTQGAFKGMSGKVCNLDSGSDKVSVLLSMFGRDTEVILDLLEIQKK
jgi:transcription termination/antitermination protein NusG